MADWADREAEKILDAFLAYEGPDDLLMLQHELVAAQRFAFEMGCLGKALDTPIAPRRLPQYLRS
jgi:hypothetical protein